MRHEFYTKPRTHFLSAIVLLCYSAWLAALFAMGYSLIALALNVAGQRIGDIYSAQGI